MRRLIFDAEHEEFRASVRRFFCNVIAPHAARWREQGQVDRWAYTKCGEQGYLLMWADEKYGGAGIKDFRYEQVMIEENLRYGELGFFNTLHSRLVGPYIGEFGNEEQKQRFLPGCIKGEKILAIAMTEPGAGSDLAGMKTRAEKTAKGYKLNGSKCWITSATKAHVAIVWAKVDGVVNGFLVPTDTPGFEARSIKEKWSFRTSDTGMFFLHDCEVPESARMPGATSLGKAIATLNNARYGIAWGVIGAARACLEETINYLVNRPQFNGKPLASHQLIQNKLAWMAAEITGMELIAKRLGELKAQHRIKPHQVSLAKMNNCRRSLEVARTCRELLGANGISNEYHIGRRMVDLETVITYEGTEHIHSLILGQHLTGIAAYS